MSSGITAFEHAELGSACDELEALGWDFAEDLLLYLQKVLSKQIDHRKLMPFATYNGVEMFMAAMGGNEFAVFSVEIDTLGDLKVSIMFAGRRNVPITHSALSWDGSDYTALRTNILNRRAAVWFD
jgi:hypothetical protein